MQSTNNTNETTLATANPTPAPAVLFAKKPKALEVMASRMSLEPAKLLETLKATVFKNCSNEELAALVVVANEYNLNPLLKEMYAFPAKGGGIVPIVSIDGWNKMMIRADNFDGIEFAFEDGDNGLPKSCTATVFIKGRSHPVKITEYFSECSRNTEPWKQMPRRMLRHKALIQAARVGFGFSGVYDEDEGRTQADEARITVATPVFDALPTQATPTLPPIAEKSEPPATEETAKPKTEEKSSEAEPLDGDKTRKINAICQEHKIEIGDALNYLGEMGFATFEDISDRLLSNITKRPADFAKAIKQGK